MRNSISKVKEYTRDKLHAWKYKDKSSLCSENPVLFELKATGDHFNQLYNIARGKKSIGGRSGLLTALNYEIAMTKFSISMR